MEFGKILVPVGGTEADDEATRLACRLARKTKGKIWVVYVITLKRSLPLEAEIEPEILTCYVAHLFPVSCVLRIKPACHIENPMGMHSTVFIGNFVHEYSLHLDGDVVRFHNGRSIESAGVAEFGVVNQVLH